MASTYDAIVVGGGAMGAACARELASSGRRVLVIEPGGSMGQAWQAAAGLLAPQIETGSDDPLLELGLAAREHYQPLAAALHETTGIDLALWQGGIARVAVTEVESAELRSKVAWQQEHGHACDWLDAGALWAPQDGALDPKRLVQALRADAERSGAVLVNDRAVRLDRDGERITGVIGEKDSYSAAEIVVAAGAWSGKLQGLPRTLPVRPVRGQMAAVPWPAAIPPAIVYHKDCYLLSRRDEAIIGSTMEDAGFNPGVTSAGLAQILAATVSLSPALMRAKVRRTWAGLRPMTPDGLPIIGRETRLGGLWYATGHGRNGILLAGITGLLVRQLIDGQQPTKDLRALSPDRF